MTLKQQLFQRFPPDGALILGGEEVTTPYHIYDGTMLSLGGTVDGKAAATLLAAEQLEPVLDTEGRALAAIWVCDFTEANLDAHRELQISLFATRRKAQPLRANPFSFYRALASVPDLVMVCHGLWNDTERVVRYNAEHLLLNAKLARSEVDFSGDPWTFEFRDAADTTIAGGSVPSIHRQPARASWKVARQMGLRGLLASPRTSLFKMSVVNTRRPGDACNHVCATYTACQKPLIRKATDEDLIVLREPSHSALDFRISFVQQLRDVGFVFMRPVPVPDLSRL